MIESRYKIKSIGRKFGKLTVLKDLEPLVTPSGQKNRLCLCKCECGNIKKVRFLHLNHNRIRSCGCLTKKLNGKSKTPIGRLYHGIKSRISHYHSERHLYYDKGIGMCEEWMNDFESFEKWCKENGYKKGLHIDRKDGNKGYSPSNCRFVTPKVNCNNRYNTKYVDYKGKTVSLQLLLKDLNYPNKYETVYSRLKRGWSIEDALFKKPNSNYSGRFK